MELECSVCRHREDYGDPGETVTCSKCGSIIDVQAATLDLRLGLNIPSTIKRDIGTLPQGSRVVGATESTVETRAPLPPATGEFVSKKMVAAGLGELDQALGEGWTALLESENYIALGARLAKARRLHPHLERTTEDGERLVDRLAGRRLDESEHEMVRSLDEGRMDDAQEIYARARLMTESAQRLDQFAARLASAAQRQRDEAEALQILEEARGLSSAESLPSNLKRALRLYDALLERIGEGQYQNLEGRFDLVREERAQVQERLEQLQAHQNDLATVFAMGEVDDLIELQGYYERALKVGRLDKQHVLGQLDALATKIRHQVDSMIEKHLAEVDGFMESPRNAEIALARLEENLDRWGYLSPPLKRRVESRYRTVSDLVERRSAVRQQCDNARQLIQQGQPADAIEQLLLVGQLNDDLQVDVSHEISIAVSSVENQVRQFLRSLQREMDDAGLESDEVVELLSRAKNRLDEVEHLAGKVDALESLIERLADAVHALRKLRKDLSSVDRRISELTHLIDQGRRREARTLLESMPGDVPPQRRDNLIDLKQLLDVAIASDDVIFKLRQLVTEDRAKAIEWASQYEEIPECRALLAQHRFEVKFAEVHAFEEAGDYRTALGRAAEMLREASDDVREVAQREVERLTHVEHDAPRVLDVHEAARKAESEGRLHQVWTLFDDELHVGRPLRAEWQRLRADAFSAASKSLTAKLTDALRLARDELDQWMKESGLDDEQLYTRYGHDDSQRNAARSHLDEAFRALDSVRLDLDFLRNRERDTLPREFIYLFDQLSIERRLCVIEDGIERADFEKAEAQLLKEDADPRLLRSRARIERLRFSWAFSQRIAEMDGHGALDVIEQFSTPAAPEVQQARRIARVTQSGLDALSIAQSEGVGDIEAIDHLRSGIRDVDAIGASDASLQALLSPLRQRLEDALARRVVARFESIDTDLLPGSVFLKYELLYRLLVIDGLRSRTIMEMQRVIADELDVGAERLLEWIEQNHIALNWPEPDKIETLLHRLGILRTAMFGTEEPNERFTTALTHLQAAWSKANEQEDARHRRDALLAEAFETLNLARLQAAAQYEVDGAVGDLLEPREVEWLARQASDVRRAALLFGIDRHFSAQLSQRSNPVDQARSDIRELSRYPELLAQWLHNLRFCLAPEPSKRAGFCLDKVRYRSGRRAGTVRVSVRQLHAVWSALDLSSPGAVRQVVVVLRPLADDLSGSFQLHSDMAAIDNPTQRLFAGVALTAMDTRLAHEWIESLSSDLRDKVFSAIDELRP